ALPSIHNRRLGSIFSAVSGLLDGRQLSLTSVGRHLPGGAKEKHKIKRVDRLLSNAILSADRRDIYRWMAHQLLGATRHPNIIVD
ncbi:MAG: IS4 family transposase, partial [Proteobacteria bacterium]|nr:IS4 family transposase [Pseudomonadota bacterium]